jgi:hypothetical protein
MARNLPPLYAYRPMSFPYCVTRSTTLTMKTVMMAEAIPRARNAMMARRPARTETKREW